MNEEDCYLRVAVPALRGRVIPYTVNGHSPEWSTLPNKSPSDGVDRTSLRETLGYYKIDYAG